jgi:hypothetical protein
VWGCGASCRGHVAELFARPSTACACSSGSGPAAPLFICPAPAVAAETPCAPPPPAAPCSHVPSDPRLFFRPDPAAPSGWAVAAKLALEDATGRLDALLLGEAAQQLLGVPACDPAIHPGALDGLHEVLARLTTMAPGGVTNSGEGTAWLEVVVSSVYSIAAAAAVAEADTVADAGEEGAEAVLSEGAGHALAAPEACIYVVHDTHLLPETYVL